jgi:hypothetical protein
MKSQTKSENIPDAIQWNSARAVQSYLKLRNNIKSQGFNLSIGYDWNHVETIHGGLRQRYYESKNYFCCVKTEQRG